MHTATVESPPKAAATAAFPDTPHLVPASLQEPLSQPAIAEAAAISFDPAQLAEEFRNFDAKSSALALAVKRALDIVVSASLLLLVLPVFAAIAALIKSSDGGPVFFLQKRVGFHGQIFPMLKFRSMVVHAERLKPPLELCNESSGPVFKMKRDPRVTPIGRFLRKYCLDELPQLINVLFGDMSVVGPRPSLPREVARYEPWQYRRFAARPGLTCFWQTSPHRYRIPFDEWMRLDVKYVNHWSLRLDLELIARTFRTVLAGTGE